MSKTDRNIKYSIDFDKNTLGIFRSDIFYFISFAGRTIPSCILIISLFTNWRLLENIMDLKKKANQLFTCAITLDEHILISGNVTLDIIIKRYIPASWLKHVYIGKQRPLRHQRSASSFSIFLYLASVR